MANAKPASAAPEEEVPVEQAPKKSTKAPKVETGSDPKIEFVGEGADKIKFTVDPKAKRIRVYANGTILTDY